MKYVIVTRDLTGGFLLFSGESSIQFEQEEAVHSFLGQRGARKVYTDRGDERGVVGTYLLPATKIAIG